MPSDSSPKASEQYSQISNAPGLGGPDRGKDLRLWGALLGRESRRREQAVRTIRALEQERWYANQVLNAITTFQPGQRASAGKSLSLLGDTRFSAPYYLSEMVAVPGGSAILGDPHFPEESPVHTVVVEPFALAQFPVTQAAYQAFVNATSRKAPRNWSGIGRRKHPRPDSLNTPVVFVSARDAEVYCEWLSSETGFTYRLPTEAEWLLAARGDNDARRYPWGNDISPRYLNAWLGQPIGNVCAVGLFPEGRGPYDHHDQAGNVWEWCSSLYWPYPYSKDDGREDPGSDSECRVMHGGSWRSRPVSVRCSARQGELPSDSFDVVGFRIARSP
nr:SUMF1/EgtB/PvdO family nonheme iron enzyme [Anaerolineae bacterium]